MGYIQTVTGKISPDEAGVTLPHEHVMVDFIGADKTGEHRWDKDEVVRTMKPYLMEAKDRGVRTFVDCSPNYLARDPVVLRRLSEETGLNILTNTGLYKEPYLPPYAISETADELARRWIDEATNGIGESGVFPGFIKIAVNPEPLAPIQRKIVEAAALCSLETGLSIAVHTAHGPAALEIMEILERHGVPGSRYVFVHADAEEDFGYHREAAQRGAWIEYDGIGIRPMEQILDWTVRMIQEGFAGQLLLSHDAGWFWVGEPGGGEVRPYTLLFDEFLPALERRGVGRETIERITIDNPARAFSVCR